MSYNYNNPVRDSKIKAGDIVLVVGWEESGVGRHEGPSWVPNMDNTIGKKYKVGKINNHYSILLIDENGCKGYNYHPAWVKVIDSYSKMNSQLLTM